MSFCLTQVGILQESRGPGFNVIWRSCPQRPQFDRCQTGQWTLVRSQGQIIWGKPLRINRWTSDETWAAPAGEHCLSEDLCGHVEAPVRGLHSSQGTVTLEPYVLDCDTVRPAPLPGACPMCLSRQVLSSLEAAPRCAASPHLQEQWAGCASLPDSPWETAACGTRPLASGPWQGARGVMCSGGTERQRVFGGIAG